MSLGFQNINSMYFTFQKSHFPKNVTDMEVIQHTTVVTYFFSDIEISIQQRKLVHFCNFQITDIFEK